MVENERFLRCFSDLGHHWKLTNDILITLEEYVCRLFGSTLKVVDLARSKRFQTFPNVSKCFQTFPTFPNVSKCFKRITSRNIRLSTSAPYHHAILLFCYILKGRTTWQQCGNEQKSHRSNNPRYIITVGKQTAQ